MSTSRQLSGLYFGGWDDYQAWADHDFRLRSPAAEAAETGPTEQIVDAGDEPAEAGMAEPVIRVLSDVPPVPIVHEPDLPPTQPFMEPIEDTPEPRQLVRPYTRTGGRTRPVFSLELETLLSCDPGHEVEMSVLRADYRAICVLCQTPQSTAELAAHLGLPLGAARVLIADVVDLGLLHVHHQTLTADNRPSLELLYRVRAGLRGL
jgi:hypothetical protein